MTGIAFLFGLVGVDGRVTAQRLDGHIVEHDSTKTTIEALAIAWCVKETDPIARNILACGERERRAGISK